MSTEDISFKDSWKFLVNERLPRIDIKTTFEGVYSQLNRTGCSGFLLSAQGEVKGYVKADELAEKVIQQAQGDLQLLRTYSQQSIGELVVEFASAVVPVRGAPGGSAAAVFNSAEAAVFSIAEDEGTAGWYINPELIREAATKKTIFLCQNGHRNPDSDHGTCYSCPFPIIGTTTE